MQLMSDTVDNVDNVISIPRQWGSPAWRNHEITEAQRYGIVTRMNKLGIPSLYSDIPKTKGEASDLIEHLNNLIDLQAEQRALEMDKMLSYDSEEPPW